MKTDIRFFTNEEGSSLTDRFKSTLKYVQFFDILVGYFRTSGFHLLQDAFKDIEKIRILVGLNVDAQTYEILEIHRNQLISFEIASHQETLESFERNLTREMEISDDKYDVEIGVKKFIEYLKSGKIEMKAHPSQNIHAKVYISRFQKDFPDFGRVITGSSNFTQSGLEGRREFNVELKDKPDVDFALAKFKELWEEGVDISNKYVDTIQKKTWLNESITPYELYLKFLYEYFKEDINIDQEIGDIFFPEGFKELEYQKQAVLSARKILDTFGGVFLADVVGLGKTFIAALLAQKLPGSKLIICPPILQEYWRETFLLFKAGNFHVESYGKLDNILNSHYQDYDYIFVDEAHRFRNERTKSYEKLYEICWGKKVILVSATPFNNSITDIYAQLKLFQVPRRSLIPGLRNLDDFFSDRERKLRSYDKSDPEYLEAIKRISNEIREKVFKYIMVRRTRGEIVNYFDDDISKRNLIFPDIADPQGITYLLDADLDSIFNETITRLTNFTYSRYMPLSYSNRGLTEFEKTQERNVGRFMRTLLVKRLESSYYAFRNTIQRFIESYQSFIEMFEKGTVYISKDVDVYDFLDADQEEELLKLIREGKGMKINSKDFIPEFEQDLRKDLGSLKYIQAMWDTVNEDPKLDTFIQSLRENENLKGQKIIVFTESSETGDYLYQNLNKELKGKVMLFTGQGGKYQDSGFTKQTARQFIQDNFDPNIKKKDQKNKIHILVTTDVLAEGINLHRSNIVVNYDLPWNPTKILQRVGRVNRVGTKHNLIHIYNFFPTDQSNTVISLEDTIKGKIQAFHNMLGEDAKYLTEDEETGSFELFGDKLYNKLIRKETYLGEEEEGLSELQFLQEIRKVRDDKPQLFEKIKRLPKKARTGRKYSFDTEKARLVSFFRKGLLKKFYLTDADDEAIELTFLDMVEYLKCQKNEPQILIGKDYFYLLGKNKQAFDFFTSPEWNEINTIKNSSNEGKILNILKTNEIRFFQGYTDEEEDFIQAVANAIQEGKIPKNTTKRIQEEISKAPQKMNEFQYAVLNILKKNIREKILYEGNTSPFQPYDRNEVILSSYMLKRK